MSGVRTRVGTVTLVGAGPGPIDLLTLRAARRLAAADLVLYDALLDAEMLNLAPRARRFYVGKRAGAHALAQREIEALMIREARRGQNVVRLKGGDPFVFGRGGEEALTLAAAGIAVEVVPGVSSAIAAASAAGVPVTHRGVTSAFVVVSGHDRASLDRCLGSLAPGSATVVAMMSLGRRGVLATLLREAGWSGDTPVAVVCSAWRDDQFVWSGPLSSLADVDVPRRLPGTIVVGEVGRVAQQIEAALSPPRSARALPVTSGGARAAALTIARP